MTLLAVTTGRTNASDWGHGAVVERDGNPVFEVDGKPFFVYGAAFFYERLPRETWRSSLVALRYGLHINVLDLYVPWNWHELSDGEFDFDGRTNPRRDLREVMRLAHALGFKIILRPGPVIRNEWRNGGYPAWLLQRPEYGMPVRDVLEGRYPATATQQNAHSDDAAEAWMRNATHLFYAKRWLERVLQAFRPVSQDVLAVALDDDQGAYIDNQTWPAPHLRSYLGWLRTTVRRATSATLPVFINTYEMKVTASSPVWAMGNWYQSDARKIGEHDRSQLDFATGLLHTRPHQPMMLSEFQAGWLQQPQDVLPQAADPSNTLLAMHTLFGDGVRGLVNFPAQDTYDPAGWEAPFANGFYAWDAALGYDSATSVPQSRNSFPATAERSGPTRATPTAYVGGLIATYGPALANARLVPDAAIAYLTSAYEPGRLTNAAVADIAGATIAAQRDCRDARLTCRLVDLRYASAGELARYPLLVIPTVAAHTGPFARGAATALRHYAASGGIVVRGSGRGALLRELLRAGRSPVVKDAGDATYAEDAAGGAGFLVMTNYGDVPENFPHASVRRLDGSTVRLPPVEIGPRDALLLPVDVALHGYAPHFLRGDVLAASSCPVVALAAIAETQNVLVTRSLPPHTVCTTRFSLLGPGAAIRTVSVASRDERFALAPGGRVTAVAAITAAVPPRSAPAAGTLPIRNDLSIEAPAPRAPEGAAIAYFQDVYRDGFPCAVLENDVVRLVISPSAGGRAFVFEDKLRARNAFDTIGALRDDVLVAPPPSATDRIAKYTHQFPAGTFNRPYAAAIVESGGRAVVRLRYEAPDAYPNGAIFERVVTLEPHVRRFTVDARATFAGDDPPARAQRGVIISSLVAGDPRAPQSTRVLPSGELLDDPATADDVAVDAAKLGAGTDNVAGLFDPVSGDLIMQAWGVTDHGASSSSRETTRRYARHITTSLTLDSRASTRTAFAYDTAATLDDARERLRRFGCDLARESGAAAGTSAACTDGAAAFER